MISCKCGRVESVGVCKRDVGDTKQPVSREASPDDDWFPPNPGGRGRTIEKAKWAIDISTIIGPDQKGDYL